MSLEGRVLSTDQVREAAKGIIPVKVDPRSPGMDRKEAQEVFEKYKTTRYVPELVLVAPDGEMLESIPQSELTPDALATKIRKAAEEAGR